MRRKTTVRRVWPHKVVSSYLPVAHHYGLWVAKSEDTTYGFSGKTRQQVSGRESGKYCRFSATGGSPPGEGLCRYPNGDKTHGISREPALHEAALAMPTDTPSRSHPADHPPRRAHLQKRRQPDGCRRSRIPANPVALSAGSKGCSRVSPHRCTPAGGGRCGPSRWRRSPASWRSSRACGRWRT